MSNFMKHKLTIQRAHMHGKEKIKYEPGRICKT